MVLGLNPTQEPLLRYLNSKDIKIIHSFTHVLLTQFTFEQKQKLTVLYSSLLKGVWTKDDGITSVLLHTPHKTSFSSAYKNFLRLPKISNLNLINFN